ncbi:MAG TPA: acyloxyacyl hydrolase [Flavipsychrobacter sp.]|nr:acyloxyacyl hydrolase [Flavipsychrobacter sp.]
MAQENQPWAGTGIEVNPFAGKIFKHTPAFLPPIPSLTTGLDVNIVVQTYGKKDWEQRRKFPVIGIGLTYINYGIDSIYGRSLGLYPNIQIPIVRGRDVEWTMRIGNGLGFITKEFERVPVDNTINNVIGSKFNDFFVFFSDVRYHINQHFDMQAGINFTHISDASVKKPNLGINTYGAHIGIRYYPVTSRPKRIVKERPRLSNRYLFQVRAGIAFQGYAAPQGPEFPTYLASAFVSRRYASRNKVFTGLDYSYHTSIYAFLRNNEIGVGDEAQHSWKSAAFLGNEFLMGRVGIVLQLGFYIRQAYLSEGPYYEKLGFNFYLLKKEYGPIKELTLDAYLKAHNTEAELEEFGIGMAF